MFLNFCLFLSFVYLFSFSRTASMYCKNGIFCMLYKLTSQCRAKFGMLLSATPWGWGGGITVPQMQELTFLLLRTQSCQILCLTTGLHWSITDDSSPAARNKYFVFLIFTFRIQIFSWFNFFFPPIFKHNVNHHIIIIMIIIIMKYLSANI